MKEDKQRSIAELLADHAAVTNALTRGVREALLVHAQAGRLVVTSRDGRAVWVEPAEILAALPRTKDQP